MRETYGIAFISLVLLGSLAVPSSPAKAAIKPNARSSATAQVVQQLHLAHKLLAEANRDYKGHRVLAMHQVHMALKELGAAPAVSAGRTTAQAQVPMHEPQARSDAQLHQALQILQGISAALNARHPKAATHVDAAMAQINTALSIR